MFLLLWLAQSCARADGIEQAGDVLMMLIPATGLGATLYIEDDKEGTLQFLESLAVSEGVTQGLKEVTDKRRPNGDCCESFPSGHASRAFMGAGFIHRRYGFKYAVPAYLGAGFVAVSRIHAEKHFVEDVVAGAAIGLASSFIFTRRYDGFTVAPFADGESAGVHMSATW